MAARPGVTFLLSSLLLTILPLFGQVVSAPSATYRSPHKPAPPRPAAPALPAPPAIFLPSLSPDELERKPIDPRLAQLSVHRPVPATLGQSGTWDVLPDGWRVWRVTLHSPGAVALRVHFEAFQSDSGRLYVNNNGPYTGSGPHGDGEFWSDLVPGDAVTIEYQTSSFEEHTPPFRLDRVSHYWSLVAPSEKSASARSAAADCHLDVTCFPDASPLARSVGLLIVEKEGGSGTCSGAAINTLNRRPEDSVYFYTAAHCFGDIRAVRSAIVVWNYEAHSCNGSVPRLDNQLPTSPVRRALTLGGWDQGDWALVELASVPDGTTLAGWTTEEPRMGDSLIGIHHPRGSRKRISASHRSQDRTLTIDQQFQAPGEFYYLTTHVRGRLEPGSSGSPLFNQQGQIVGSLSYTITNKDGNVCTTEPFQGGYGRLTAAWSALAPVLAGQSPAPDAPPAFRLEEAVVSRHEVTQCAAPEATARFQPSDDRMLVYLRGEAQRGGRPRFDFVNPAGELELRVDAEPAPEDGRFCWTAVLPIAGNERANRAGNWVVRGFWGDQALFARAVTLERASAPIVGGGALTSGEAKPFRLPAVQSPTLFREQSFRIEVPARARRLEVALNTTTPGVDLDLYIRRHAPPTLEGNAVVADFRSESESGSETLVITPDSDGGLPAGTYYVTLSVYSTGRASEGTVRATVVTENSGADAGVVTLESGRPQTLRLPAVERPALYVDVPLRIVVPAGATRLDVRLTTATAGVDLDLFVRRDAVAVVEDGRIVADHSAQSDSGDEMIVITPGSSPALRAGTYFISLASFTPGRATSAVVTATVSMGSTMQRKPVVLSLDRSASRRAR